MDFDFDEEQRRLAESVREVVSDRYPTSYVRSMLDDVRGFSKEFWRDAAELGWVSLLIPEAYGGAGLGPVELVAVQQELGRGVIPGPYLSSAVLGAAAILRLGSETQKQRWLPRLAAGEAIATLALPEARGGWDPATVTLAAEPASGRRFRLSGTKCFVPDADEADLLLVVARDATLFAVERGAPGVSVRPLETIDPTRRLGELTLDGVEVDADAVLGEPGASGPALESVLDLGRVALCAEMVGGAERALEMSIDYARTREQFRRPIGSFQAIQHKVADMMVKLEGARSMTFAAATSLAHGDADASDDASIAKAWCGEVYRFITTEGVQIHGGLGFTWELDMHLYYKRARACEMLLGDARFHRARVAERFVGAA